MTGFFIAIEGIDGAGKDTLAEKLKSALEGKGEKVVLTAEPTEGEVGRRIRAILDHKLPPPTSNYEFQKLYVEDRLEHINTFIQPQLNKGAIVITSRYWFSTIAYGMLEGPAELYIELHRSIIGADLLLPDLTIILDVTPEEGLKRVMKAGRGEDWFTKTEKLSRIRENYLELVQRKDLGRITVINGVQPLEAVFGEALEAAMTTHSAK